MLFTNLGDNLDSVPSEIVLMCSSVQYLSKSLKSQLQNIVQNVDVFMKSPVVEHQIL